LKIAGLIEGKPVTNSPPAPQLFNLDQEIGERTDLAAKNPEIVQRLQKLIAEMAHDLGLTNAGPGVRPPGRVAKPVGLWLPGHSPKAVPAP
jgi:arylsulfatase A